MTNEKDKNQKETHIHSETVDGKNKAFEYDPDMKLPDWAYDFDTPSDKLKTDDDDKGKEKITVPKKK